MKEYFIIKKSDKGRIDTILARELSDLSRSYVQHLIKDKKIKVNGEPTKSSYQPVFGDRVEIDIPESLPPSILPQNIPLDILYEDDSVIVVNKPKNMVVHPCPGHYSDTLVNALLWHCEGQLSGINGVMRPGIIHRIDKDTTGSLLVCKTDTAHKNLSEQLKDHKINRIYKAIIHGRINKEGTISTPIGRDPKDRKKMGVCHSHGKPAVTHYRVVKSWENYSYIECQLETGRTHQIRVHMSSIGHPILGDDVYGPKKPGIKGLTGQTLHAQTLGFIHPVSHQYMEFQAPLPAYFQKLLNTL